MAWGQRPRGFSGLFAATAAITAGVPAAAVRSDPTQMEARVLAVLNDARLRPRRYVTGLTAFRSGFRRKLVTMPGTRIVYVTREGTLPLDEAVAFLANKAPRSGLLASPLLAAAAADHVAQQSRSGRLGHFDRSGLSPADRIARRGGGRMVSEVISYGAFDAADVVRQLIVDDGVPDRSHRSAVFAARLRYAGVACGRHPTFRTMCVIEMAETPDGRSARALRRIRLTSIGG